MSNSLFIATNGYHFRIYFFSSTNHHSSREFKLLAISDIFVIFAQYGFLSCQQTSQVIENKQTANSFTVSVNPNYKSQKEGEDIQTKCLGFCFGFKLSWSNSLPYVSIYVGISPAVPNHLLKFKWKKTCNTQEH